MNNDAIFCLLTNYVSVYIQIPGNAERLANAQEVFKFQGGSIMIWGGIMMNGKTELILVRGKMTINRYEAYILQPIVLPL